MQWLWYSLIASVVLTVVLNLAIRRWPGTAGRPDDRVSRQAPPTAMPEHDESRQRVGVMVPWKAMLLASLVGTVLLNVVLRLA